HQTHIDLDRLLGADARDSAGLECPQQLDLRFGRHLRDLVEKQSPATGLLEEPAVLARGPREAPLLVSKELALDQRRGDRSAVDRYETASTTRAQGVDDRRHFFLARAALAGEQYRNVRGRDFADQIVDLLHRLGGTDQRTEAAELEERCAHGVELALELV